MGIISALALCDFLYINHTAISSHGKHFSSDLDHNTNIISMLSYILGTQLALEKFMELFMN